MSDTKPMAEWIYENVERDLDKKRDDDPNSVTESVVEQCFLTWLKMAKYYPDFMNIKLENPKAFIDKLIQDYKTKEDFLKPVGFCYQDDRIEPWLNIEKPNIDWFYWNRYHDYLRTKKHWSTDTLRSMDRDTDNILDVMANPKMDEPFDRRGLVVASVQSGKTANYIGLISKAADAGYKIIIVMAGIYNVLRNQTQERIEDGFVGYDLVSKKYVGVGNSRQRRPLLGTSRIRDFNKATEDAMRGVTSGHVQEPLVFVIKKNTNSLREISLWLENNCKDDGPLLLIDDEADNASINVKYDKGEVSKINGQIRKILGLFAQSAYVGYTATPFANVLIDSKSSDEEVGDDIFPRSFIYTLEQSTAYFGAEKVFGDIDDPKPKYVRWIFDDDESRGIKRRSGDVLDELPQSLEQAIDTFIVACAMRVLSGDGDEHMTMMINMSPYKTVQHSIYYLVGDYVELLRGSINSYAALPSSLALNASAKLRELYQIWEKEYSGLPFTWNDVLGVLQETIRPVTLAEINSQSKDGLDYMHAPQRVIAIGGYRLSRGLTLEGLLVSYYARNARAYDSLMQMARWFGYRFGYENLCRVWMTEQSARWYAYVANATKELTDEVRAMRTARSTPIEYGLRIKSSPDTLMITARNKMGSGTAIKPAKVRLDGAFVETTAFDRDPETLSHNEKLAQNFLKELQAQHCYPDKSYSTDCGKPSGKLIRCVPSSLIRDYIRRYRNSSGSPKTNSEYLLRHINLLDERGYDDWDVFVTAGRRSETHASFTAFGDTTIRERRAPGCGTNETVFYVSRMRLSSRGVEKVILNNAEIAQAEKQFHEENPHKENVADVYYRRIPGRRPLLIIHPVALQFKNTADYEKWLKPENKGSLSVWPSATHVEETVGWSISFPEVGIREEVTYVYNDVMLRQIGHDIESEGNDDDEPDL